MEIIENFIEDVGIQSGVCLQDQSRLPGFDWADLDNPKQALTAHLAPALAVAMQQRTASLLANLRIERPGDTPNRNGFGGSVPMPCREVVLHWWGNPVGQKHDGIVAWLRNPASGVSSTVVVSPGKVTQLMPWNNQSWANGHTWANANSITLECDPNNITGTISTVCELLIWLVEQGILHRDFRLTGHRDWYSTACPGNYYPRLSEIRRAVYEGGNDMQLSDIVTRADGHKGTVNDVLAYMDQRIELMFKWFGEWSGNGMLDAVVERHGLPESDPRHDHKVKVKEIFAWSDYHFTALLEGQKALIEGQKALMESVAELKNPEAVARLNTAINNVQNAITTVKENRNA